MKKILCIALLFCALALLLVAAGLPTATAQRGGIQGKAAFGGQQVSEPVVTPSPSGKAATAPGTATAAEKLEAGSVFGTWPWQDTHPALRGAATVIFLAIGIGCIARLWWLKQGKAGPN